MQKLSLLLIPAFIAMANLQADAATDTPQTFTVTGTLNSACKLNSVGNMTFSYTSFSLSDVNPTGGAISYKCTQNYAATSFTLDGTGSSGVYSYTDSATGIVYSLKVPATVAGQGLTNITSSSITGTVASGQAGTCSSATCSINHTRTLTLNF